MSGMADKQLIHGAESRYALYELDPSTRERIKTLWPIIEPHLDKAVDVILDAAMRLPSISAIVEQHRSLVKSLEISHLKALLNGDLDAQYLESCRKTVEQESALGFDARLR